MKNIATRNIFGNYNLPPPPSPHDEVNLFFIIWCWLRSLIFNRAVGGLNVVGSFLRHHEPRLLWCYVRKVSNPRFVVWWCFCLFLKPLQIEDSNNSGNRTSRSNPASLRKLMHCIRGRYVDLHTKFRRSLIWLGVSVVLMGRLESFSNFCRVYCLYESSVDRRF